MKIYVMRHGPAEDASPSVRDADRALTDAGRERTLKVARELGVRDETPRRVMSSPLKRAVQTARIVVEELRVPGGVETAPELAPGGDADRLVRDLVRSGAKRVMLVGHEPDVSSLLSRLWAGWSGALDKSMVVSLRVREDRPSRLRFVLEPKSLKWREG